MVSVSDWWESVVFICKKLCLCQSLLTNTKNQARFNKSMLHRPPSHLLKRQCCWSQRKVQGEETKAVSAWPTQEFTKFRFSSSSLGDDLNVTRVRYPSSCFMKTLCLESTLHIMLPRPIGPCIRKKGGELESCPSSSWLGAHNHVLQWWAAGIVIWLENSNFWRTDKEAGREWHQSQHLSSDHSDLSCLIEDEAFRNTCVVACLALLQACTAAKVSRSEFCNIQLAFHLIVIPPWFRSQTLSESQDVSGSSWEGVDPNVPPTTKSASLTWRSKLDKQKSTYWLLTTHHEVSVICKLTGLRNALSSRMHASNG